jgi:hypothetical protein
MTMGTLFSWVLLAALLPLPAFAGTADPKAEEFAARFEITAVGEGPYFRVPLTADVFRYSRTADLADVRLFNAAGDALPFALYAAAAEKPEESEVPLPVYPIEAGVLQAAIAGGRLEIHQQGGATTVVIEGERRAGAKTRVAAFLLDARQVKARAVALELDAEFDHARLVPVSVQASRDLKRWRTLAAGEPVFRLGQGAHENVRSEVRFANAQLLDGEYLRLTWAESARFELRGAILKTLPAASPPPPPPVDIGLGVPAAFKAREVEWTLETPLRFAQLAVRAAEPNTLAPVTVMARPRIGEPWRAIGRGVVYRVVLEGEERFSPAISVAAGSYAAIRLVLDEAAPALGTTPPAMALRLAPREVAFLARGARPYQLAVGHEQTARAALPLASLVPDYQHDAERKFAVAALGPARIDETRLPQPPSLLFGLDGRTVTLWAVLIGAVLLLSTFAFSLLRRADRARANEASNRN